MNNQFLLGTIVMACAAIGVFFLRFWRKTHDRFFVMFAIAFWLMGMNWLALAFTDPNDPNVETRRAILYLIRLLAFIVIIWAIWDKNRATKASA